MENKMEEVLKELEELKKKLENKQGETNFEKAVRINEEMTKNSKKNMKDNYEQTSKDIEDLRKDARCLICLTDIGVKVMGTKTEILALISSLVEHLTKKDKINEKDIRFAFESGLMGIEKARKQYFDEDINKQIDEMMNELFGE